MSTQKSTNKTGAKLEGTVSSKKPGLKGSKQATRETASGAYNLRRPDVFSGDIIKGKDFVSGSKAMRAIDQISPTSGREDRLVASSPKSKVKTVASDVATYAEPTSQELAMLSFIVDEMNRTTDSILYHIGSIKDRIQHMVHISETTR